MRVHVVRVETWTESIALTRPYAIAFQATDRVELGCVRVELDDGTSGFGCAAPVEEITGESFAACTAALMRARELRGDDPRIQARLEAEFVATPAARAAVDGAIHDAVGRKLGRPLVEVFGRAHKPLPTSVTIGIRSLADTLSEADEYLARGFTILKIKIGEALEHDIERLARLREHVGGAVILRADANVGYDVRAIERFCAETERFDIEFLEQPAPRALDDELRSLPASIRARLAADESLFDVSDALRLAREPHPFGIWNLKLQKCGGIAPARRIARFAEAHGIDVMWGCMDESVVGIAAALHLAYHCPATRYLDLDGSLDLARDPFRGGFALRDGVMHTLDATGLGVERNA
ncbi:MAG: dipeptide epimerase [Planctomycetes bacterium]|nr:dipeptide epimerase [Planctomycetota bacterium]